ncbi:flagellar biosynthetic protein FliO [Clostridium sp. DMHC 10]|uniref:flagellar biosynthetic protein FliO n=1 Tax=Clostridium sp. DMHC 10 TaxID=747377 RepID=UPI000B1F22AA|nr:flagellar biosynthetic protein FliO [Clostridium sp. DMHC 10]
MIDTAGMIIKFIIFFPMIILLIYVSLKYGGSKFQGMQNEKYIKVLEKTSLSKDTSLLVIKIGSKGYIMSSTTSKTEILMEIDGEELSAIEKVKKYHSIKV